MEMGKGYAFVARQQHIKTDLDDFYIDLVFYNYILKFFVLIVSSNPLRYQQSAESGTASQRAWYPG